MLRSIGSLTVLALLMVGCGGGGSDGGSMPPPPPPPPANFTVGGTVTGLTSTGLVLTFSDSNLSGPHSVGLAVSTSGEFTFVLAVPQGSSYTVDVGTQPSAGTQNCVVTNGTGVVGPANVTNVTVTCSNVAGYTVSGTVSGLVGSGLALAICRFHSHRAVGGFYDCGSSVQVSANGVLNLGDAYPAVYYPDRVEITQQPSSPTQRCVVYNASITANTTSVMVACAGFSYVTNTADNTLAAYAVDATTGALALVSAPMTAGTSPSAMVGTGYEEKIFVFVGNEGSNDISAFAVNKITGALTTVPGSPFAAGIDPQAMANATGSYLYAANAGSDTVSAYAINGDTGALTPLVPATYPTGKGPASIVFDNLGGFVFVANHGGSNDISVFNSNGFNAGTLLPVAGSPFPAGSNPLSLALGAAGKFLYTANPDATNPSISGFSIDPVTGALSPLSGSPFPLSVSHYMATDLTGAYLYVTTGANIVGYAIDATSGALTALPGFPVAAGADAYSVSIDPSNQFLYVANDGASNISGFKLDTSTGALTPLPDSPFAAGNRPGFVVTF
jgi:6-phosphogluconolactonase (cycloisomerase 2 family)